jgi:hypothetical protein
MNCNFCQDPVPDDDDRTTSSTSLANATHRLTCCGRAIHVRCLGALYAHNPSKPRCPSCFNTLGGSDRSAAQCYRRVG